MEAKIFKQIISEIPDEDNISIKCLIWTPKGEE